MSSTEPFQTPHPRRKFLGTMGLAGAGWMASSALSGAAGPRRDQGGPIIRVPGESTQVQPVFFKPLPALDLPQEWISKNRGASEYLRYLQSLRLERVNPQQVLESHAKERSGVWNGLPPKDWWARMGYVLKVVDRVAREMNVKDVEVISAYRNPAYNARCHGAKSGSWHQLNVACDVKFPVRASKVTAAARELRNLGLFRGGVGGYWDFTHIDARGQNVDW